MLMKCDLCFKESANSDKFCRNCGEQLPEEEVYACECGSEVNKEDKFCHGCGAPFSISGSCDCGNALAENAKFCHNCGKEILKAENKEEGNTDNVEVLEVEEPKGYYRQDSDGTYTFIKGKSPSSPNL